MGVPKNGWFIREYSKNGRPGGTPILGKLQIVLLGNNQQIVPIINNMKPGLGNIVIVG